MHMVPRVRTCQERWRRDCGDDEGNGDGDNNIFFSSASGREECLTKHETGDSGDRICTFGTDFLQNVFYFSLLCTHLHIYEHFCALLYLSPQLMIVGAISVLLVLW